MIIRKITEVTETQTTETFQLICHEKDEGWELTREEMEKLRAMTERSLEGFHNRRQQETYDEIYFKMNRKMADMGAQLDTLATYVIDNVPGEPSKSEGVVDTVIRLLDDKYKPEESSENITEEAKCRVCGCTWDNACQGGCYWVEEDLCSACVEKADDEKECPDYIEPPAPEVVCENGVCQLVLPEEEEIPKPAAEVTESSENLRKSEEKVQELEEKVQKREPRDFSKYVDLVLSGVNIKQITEEMAQDMGIAIATATTYMYSKVKPLAAAKDEQDRLRAIEAEKKQLEKKIEKKIQVIPPTEAGGSKPEKGKYFSDEERLRIQKKLGLK